MDWNGALARAGIAPDAQISDNGIGSKILRLTMVSQSVMAAGRVDGVEIRIHRVLAGRYSMENPVALAVIASPDVRATSIIRPRFVHRLLHLFTSAPVWKRIAYVIFLPLMVFLIPGLLLGWTLAATLRSRTGTRVITAGEGPFRSRYVVEAANEADARAAAPISLQRVIVANREMFAQTVPGALILEARLAEIDLGWFVAHAIATARGLL